VKGFGELSELESKSGGLNVNISGSEFVSMTSP
jgi:hypothetical protein